MNGVKKEKEVSGMDEKKTRPIHSGGEIVKVTTVRPAKCKNKRKKEWDGGVADWAWYITWAIMLASLIKSFF